MRPYANQKLIFGAILSFTCLALFGSSFPAAWRQSHLRAEECSIWQHIATDIMNEDVEGLQRLLEEQRLANPAIADPIDRAIHIIEGPDAHHDHGPEPAGAPEDQHPTAGAAEQTAPEAKAEAAKPNGPAVPGAGTAPPAAGAKPPEGAEETPTLPPALVPFYDASLMTAKFWEDARKKRDEVEQRWMQEPLWRDYPKADISRCPATSPECLLWTMPQVNQTKTRANKVYRKCCVEHDKLKHTMDDVFRFLHKHKIGFWLGMGSLLGAHRNNGTIIAWDTDADLYVSEDDEQRLLDALKGDDAFGHYWEKDHSPKRRPMYWIYYEKNQPISSPGMGDTHVEIWMWKWKKVENKQIIYPLRACPLYGVLPATCPAQTEALLNKHYPLGWKAKYSLAGGRATLNLSIM